jgi:hypothetical protein
MVHSMYQVRACKKLSSYTLHVLCEAFATATREGKMTAEEAAAQIDD